MVYNKVKSGIFLSRPNRFIAMVSIDGRDEVCHVKNTGRCRELLTRGAEVFLSESDNPTRKTKYDLIAANKNGRLINMDSQAPNAAAAELLPTIFPNSQILREKTYGSSRFDFYIEGEGQRAFLEVKGVTLEENGKVMFPDAPTERGVKHLRELIKCLDDGYRAYILFIIQMESVDFFTPNDATHKEFGDTLREAQRAGVTLLAYDCRVTPDSMTANNQVPIIL